jgi:hypothetical protein
MNRYPRLITIVILCVCSLIFAPTLALAQTEKASAPPASDEPNSPESSTCFATVTAGVGPNQIKLCISQHGNILDFESPQGKEHMTPGTDKWGDGYVLCSTNNNTANAVNGYDASNAELGWGNATAIQPNGLNTLPLTIIRSTTNGKFELKQTFAWDTNEKDVTITMTLKNISNINIDGIRLARYFDADLSGDISDDRFDKTDDSVWGRDGGGGSGQFGLMLTAVTFNQAHSTGVETFSNWVINGGGFASVCNPPFVSVPTSPGNYVGRLTYFMPPLAPGESKIVKLLYRRF